MDASLKFMKSARGRRRKRRKGSSPLLWVLSTIVVFFVVNWVIQVARKPTELIGLFEGGFHKTPEQTWQEYGSAFREKSTPVMTPDFLAALAQAESSGNPIVRTYWKWNWTLSPERIFAPASSAVGIFQITEGTFEEARKFCIRDGQAYHDDKGGGCWSNFAYSRVVPSHAIEMTSARLHYHVDRIVTERGRQQSAGLRDRQALATIIHLCGVRKGEAFAKVGFNVRRLGRCGDHSVSAYLGRVRRLQEKFRLIADQGH